ncbi:bifunctional lytic transglycosylase/C40 family peptidase [Ectobacillus panaciterrae]|uniref:bifunctional lytic transglycosylase/C40 family peptidase n=1 Tax=Ectobacillus panaciterrae TaxID=363872 RepID=UPI00041EA866|nr:bifunctional lytic transglycosylase/C40 family peptidase [Ectobacillus panaciterrae]
MSAIDTAKGMAKQYVKRAAAKKIAAVVLKNPYVLAILGVILLLIALMGLLFFFLLNSGADTKPNTDSLIGNGAIPLNADFTGGHANVSSIIRSYEPLIREEARKNGIEGYTELLLAITQNESGENPSVADIMQASESQGLPPNTISDPYLSIQIGVRVFAERLRAAGGDVPLAIHTYNYGMAFVGFVLQNGGKYTKDLALQYSREHSTGIYSCIGRDPNNYRTQAGACYGDFRYVEKILQLFTPAKSDFGNLAQGSQIFDVTQVENIMKQFLGMPYQWGGRTPATSFDCSGLMEWSFAQVGINISGTAEDQFNKTVAVPDGQQQPGDLVFWETYKAAPSHVGLYVGNDSFLNANDKGIEYSSVSRWSKAYKFLGYRRIVR